MKIKFHYFIFIFLFTNIVSFTAYFTSEIFCANDFVDYITSSNGDILPQRQSNTSHRYRDYHFVYNFTHILHNFDQQICIHLVNLRGKGGLAFKNVSINEYDITLVNYEDFYSCNECNDAGPKKFVKTSESCVDKNIISTGNAGNYFNTVYYNFCLDPKSDITSLFIDNSKINQNFYKGKEVKYILYDNNINLNIDNIFTINGNENLVYFLDTVSLEITSITNKKGKIYHESEELNVNSFFNPKNNYLTYKRSDDEGGYIMTITIETKPKNKNIDIRTCETEAKIYLYVPLKNCTMAEFSDNLCPQCINNNYAKNVNENRCYDKSEKFTDLYSESSSQIWKNCENEKNSFICSICPKGTFIKNELGQICEKCPKGEYSNNIDQNKCGKCDKGSYSNVLGSTSCQICQDGYFSPKGADKCSLCEELIPNCNSCSKQLICLECNNEAVPGYENCTICENNMDWKFLGNRCLRTTICEKYYYKDKKNNNKINCIQNINECPEEMNFLNLDTGECRQNVTAEEALYNRYQIKGRKEELDEFSQNFVNRTWSDAFFEYLMRNNFVLEGENSNLRISKVENLTGIDFGECPFILRAQYKTDVMAKVIEFEFKGKRIVNYTFLDANNMLKPLNSSACENQRITILSQPPYETLYYFQDVIKFQPFYQIVKEGQKLFDEYSDFYQDFCYPVSVLDQYDLTLKQRREFLANKNLSFCGKDCQYEGENWMTLEVKCYCPLKQDIDQEILKQIEEKNKTKLENLINYKVITCLKLNFSLLGQKGNYFSYVYIFLFILDIILIIINEIFLEKNLNDLIKYCKEYIVKNNSNDDNLENQEFKNLRYMYLNKNINNTELKNNFEKFKFEKIVNNPVKKGHWHNIKNKKNEGEGVQEKIIENNKAETAKEDSSLEIKEEIENNDDDGDYYYLYLIYIYKKKDRKNYLIDEELNNLDFNLYKNIESRSLFEIYCSIFKTEYKLSSTFFILNTKNDYYNDYRLYIIKIMIYISSLTFSIITNILFYNDKTMRKLVEDNGKFSLKYKLPRIIIIDIAMDLFYWVLEKLIDFQDDLVDLKNNLDLNNNENIKSNNSRNKKKINYLNINVFSTARTLNQKIRSHRRNISNKIDLTRSVPINQKIDNDNNVKQKKNKDDNDISNETKGKKEEIAESLKKRFRRNRIIFYFIILIFKLFSWYFISCFCALYKSTQKHLGIDFVLGLGNDLITSFFTSIYFLIIRIFIIKSSFCNCYIRTFYSFKSLKINKFLKEILNFMKENAEKLVIYAFQKTIELLIALYIIDKIPALSDF